MGSKYTPLEEYLKNKGMDHVPMTFSEIEEVIGDSLPRSARAHRAWWSNNPSNSVITYAWLAAGYKTRAVNMEAESLVFERDPGARALARPAPGEDAPPRHGTHPLFGCMAGTITFTDPADLTAPADPGWADLAGAVAGGDDG